MYGLVSVFFKTGSWIIFCRHLFVRLHIFINSWLLVLVPWMTEEEKMSLGAEGEIGERGRKKQRTDTR